jgi:hypothetical protein
MISKLLITMPAEVGTLAALGEAVRKALTELQASAATASDVELCVNEAVNNAIERRVPGSPATSCTSPSAIAAPSCRTTPSS